MTAYVRAREGLFFFWFRGRARKYVDMHGIRGKEGIFVDIERS
jgi:hypothetical protein